MLLNRAHGPDCHTLVPEPIDVAPIRSPQEVHSVIGSLLEGKRLVELGTRNGDGMMCFARIAASTSAIEYDDGYCKKLKLRADLEKVPLEVQCMDYKKAQLDADYITWWQQAPMTNHGILSVLKEQQYLGNIRLSAEAIVIFDHSWLGDRQDLDKLQPLFSWEKRVQFDERERCDSIQFGIERSEVGFKCDRSQGLFTVARIKIVDFPSETVPSHSVLRNSVQGDSRLNFRSTSIVCVCMLLLGTIRYAVTKCLKRKARRR